MAVLRQTAFVFLAVGMLAAADFHTDVVKQGKLGNAQKALLGKLRRLDAHEDMSPEDQEKMGKCMMGDCAAKFEAAEAGGEALCEAVDCAKADENCAPILTMMEKSPDMPAGMLKCVCGEGACLMTEEVMKDSKEMCKFYDCTQKNDHCKAMMESEDMAGGMGMAACMCTDPAIQDFVQAATDSKGACKDFQKDGRRLDAHEEDGGGLDVCKVSADAPDGDCAKALAPGWRKIQTEAACADMKKELTKDTTADEQKCIDDMMAANPEPTPEPDEAAASDAVRAALPGLVGFLFAGFVAAN